MSEDALNAAIASKWESAGLDASQDGMDVGVEEDVTPAENTDDIDPNPPDTDDTEVVPDPNAEEVPEPDTTEQTETETAPAIDDATTAEAATPEQVKEAEDDLAAALGLGKPPEDPKKRAQWWKTRVPYSQLHKVVTEREKKLAETHEGVLKERDSKIASYDTRFADVGKVEHLIKTDHETYLGKLAEMFPETYGKFLAPIFGKGGDPAKLAEVEDPGPKPEPDYKLPDGSLTYSVDGHQKLLDWQQKVTEQKMLQRFKPHLDYVDQQQKAAEKKAREAAIEDENNRHKQSVNDAITEVETWEHGKENLEEIVAAAAKIEGNYSARERLMMAYNRVLLPKLKADRDKMTKEILAQQKKASAKQTSQSLTQTRPTPVQAEKSGNVDDKIKAKWKRDGLI